MQYGVTTPMRCKIESVAASDAGCGIGTSWCPVRLKLSFHDAVDGVCALVPGWPSSTWSDMKLQQEMHQLESSRAPLGCSPGKPASRLRPSKSSTQLDQGACNVVLKEVTASVLIVFHDRLPSPAA